jgi:hypothetical protein
MRSLSIAAATLIFAAAPALAQEGWGNIKGRVVWGPKDIPEQKPIKLVHENADKDHCLSKGEVLSEQWVVNKKNRGLQWTFVWLVHDDKKDKDKPLPIHPKLKDVPASALEIDQPLCAFVPHAVAIRQGQGLVAKNSSPKSHSFKWTGVKDENQGNITIPAGQQSKPIKLIPERLPIKLECTIHPWMNGYCGVFNHPYFAITDADGKFEIKDAPAGQYRLIVWNGAFLGGVGGRFGQQITIRADGTVDLGELEFAPPKE